jgi:hypothetical protein
LYLALDVANWRIFRAIVNADEADLPSLTASQASVRNPNAGQRGALREQLSDVRVNHSNFSCGRDTTIQTNNRLESAILRRKVPINTLRMWALRFREKLLVCVEDCLEK